MTDKIVARTDPQRPTAYAPDVLDQRVPKSAGMLRDLTDFKGTLLRLSARGVAQATNTDPQNVNRLIELGVFGKHVRKKRDEVLHDPANTRADLFAAWAARQPEPASLDDFDSIYEVRAKLHLHASTPYPFHFVNGAHTFLLEHGMATLKEFAKLLHLGMASDHPSRELFSRLAESRKPVKVAKISLGKFRKLLPECLADFEGTALEAGGNDVLAHPSENALGRIATLGPLRSCVAIHILRLASRVVSESHISGAVTYLAGIDKEMQRQPDSLDRLQAADRVIEQLIEQAADRSSPAGRRAGNMLTAWSGMTSDLEIATTGKSTAIRDELGWTASIQRAGVKKFQVDRIRRSRQSGGSKRLETSSALADELPAITAALDLRYRGIESLHEAWRDTVTNLMSDSTLACAPLVHEWHEVDDSGLPTGEIARHEFRVWRTPALLEQMADTIKEGSLRSYNLLYWAKRGTYPPGMPDTLLEYVGSASSKSPFFVDIYAANIFGGALTLDKAVRRKRYATLAAWNFPSSDDLPRGMIAYPRDQEAIYRTALNMNRILVPMEELKLGMQVARTVFNIGLITAARSGEILQILMDGSNLHYDEESDLAFWRAVPKQPSDRADPVPLTRDYFLDEHVLSQIKQLRDDMRVILGPRAASEPIRPAQELAKLDPAAWLFRTENRMLGSGSLKMLLCYLSAGLAVFGVHDIRAAISKYRRDQGDSIAQIAELLGHSGRGQAENYSRPTERMVRRRNAARREETEEYRRLQRLDKIRNRAA